MYAIADRISVVQGDITQLTVDVVVNAANAALSGGGGVDGAIHRAGGPGLLAECRTLGAARPGEVKLTAAYNLPAKHVAHAVGPVWRGGDRGEAELLASCYRRALELAADVGAQSIAFPSISTGAYRFPIDKAARIAVDTVHDFLATHPLPKSVTFCCFSTRDADLYRRMLAS